MMHTRLKILFTSISCFMMLANIMYAQLPKVYFSTPERIVAIKKAAQTDSAVKKNIIKLAAKADRIFNKKFSSVMDKKFIHPCGNEHEYMSLARYYWPDSTKPDGSKYIRKDGQSNPEALKISDGQNLGNLIVALNTLAYTYYYTDNNKYAEKAVQLIRFWFIDTATMMLPNLNHSGITTRHDTGRGSGIIDTHTFPIIIDAIGLISSSESWKKSDEVAIKQWFEAYLNWLMTSKNGIHESKTSGNHKTYYDNQIATISLFCGKKEIAQKVLENAKSLIASQIEPNGEQPNELVRTLGLGYSTFNLKALFFLATVAETQGIDLWNYQTTDGRSIRKVLDYLLPYVVGGKKWPHQQIGPYKTRDYFRLLMIAASKFKDDTYKIQAEKIRDNNTNLFIELLNG